MGDNWRIIVNFAADFHSDCLTYIYLYKISMIRNIVKVAGMACALIVMSTYVDAQTRTESLRYGDMEHWVTRHIKESAVIGGQDKTLYEIGPDTVIDGNVAYRNLKGSQWGSSNVMAKVAGVVKTNTTVSPDTHRGGRCAKLTTHVEQL